MVGRRERYSVKDGNKLYRRFGDARRGGAEENERMGEVVLGEEGNITATKGIEWATFDLELDMGRKWMDGGGGFN